jgi:hypothetical protein
VYVAIAVILGFVLGVGLTAFLLTGPIPLRDRGSRIFAASSVEGRDAVVKVLAHFGLKPRYRIDSREVSRALMSDNQTIVNYTTDPLWETMGRPAAGLALTVKNPAQAAASAVSMLRGAGFEAEVLGELDPDVPKGAMVFVKTNALEATLLVFRRHFFKMGKRPPRW